MFIDGSFVCSKTEAAKRIGKHKSVIDKLVEIGYLGYIPGRSNHMNFSNKQLADLVEKVVSHEFPSNIDPKFRTDLMELFPRSTQHKF